MYVLVYLCAFAGAGKTRVTLTNHKKSVRALVLHPTQYTFASASTESIKQWRCPNGEFLQSLSGHNAIVNALALNPDGVLVSGGARVLPSALLYCSDCIYDLLFYTIQI